MNDVHLRAGSYLAPSVDSFWRWSGDGEVLTWADGKTIAFRPEVRAVLGRLATRGLPPFGAVVLLLAACREGWEASAGRDVVSGYGRVFQQWRTDSSVPLPSAAPGAVFQRVAAEVERIVRGLDRVAALPADVREGSEAKAVLAETVFEAPAPGAARAAGRLSPGEAASLLEAMDEGIDPALLLPRLSTRESLAQFADEVDGLSAGLARVNADSLALRARTGLDRLVRPAEPDLAPAERVRRLLAELREDRELAGLARLARDLMAAASVPRSLHARDEMPLGGVSDLSNRGALDRLLVSELAHDDLTLAVRVATGEALYLRREAPPKEPPGRRAVLLDFGIRLWGLPRAFAAAVALALAATTDKKADLFVCRATRDGVEPVDLTTRPGLVACLAALEPEPHPGGSLAAFFQTVREREQAGGGAGGAGATDAVLVTHPDVLADPDFAAALSSTAPVQTLSLYLATVDRAGAFGLFAQTAAGRKRVREARLSLESLLEPPAVARAGAGGAGYAGDAGEQPTPLRVRGLDPALPVILSADVLPLRLPCVADPRFAAASPKWGLVAATRDGRLMHWDGPQRGGRQLTPLLPRGGARAVFIEEDAGRAHVLLFHRRTTLAYLVTADLLAPRDPCRQALLDTRDAQPRAVFAHLGLLYFVSANRADAFDLASGALVGRLALPKGMRWHNGRMFRLGTLWYAMSFNGFGVTLEKVPLGPDAGTVVAVIESEGRDGPLVLFADGRVTGTASDAPAWHPVGRVDELLAVSPDGLRVAVRGDGNSLLIFAPPGNGGAGGGAGGAGGSRQKLIGNPLEALLRPWIGWSRFSLSPRNRFRGISIGPRGELCLVARHNTVSTVGMNGRGELALTDQGRTGSPPHWLKNFTHHPRVPGMRFNLAVAAWSDGSRAYLDSRGMLHLVSSDPSVPQVTLTLTSASVLAGWSSEGKVFGPPYFIGDAAATDAAHFDRAIHAFTARLR